MKKKVRRVLIMLLATAVVTGSLPVTALCAENTDVSGIEYAQGLREESVGELLQEEELPGETLQDDSGESSDDADNADSVDSGGDSEDAGEINGEDAEGSEAEEAGDVDDGEPEESDEAEEPEESDESEKLEELEDPEEEPVSIEDADITGISDREYTGESITFELIVSVEKDGVPAVLEEGTDYTVTYKNNIKAGTASVTVEGTGKYTGTVTREFTITPVKLYSARLKYASLVYTGEPRTQTKTTVVKAKVNGSYKELVRGTDYSVTYSANKNVGIATMTVEGKGNYQGQIIKRFRIIPAGTSITSITGGTKTATVNWEKQTTQTNGYQVQYCLKKDFSSGAKKVNVDGNKTLKTVIKGLAVGKKYYVRIRTFKIAADEKKYYSNWSKVKGIKLTYNAVSVTGSGVTRTVTLDNPKDTVKTVKTAIWSKTGGQDDVKWYNLKKNSDGSFSVKIYAVHLKHYGTAFAHIYMNGSTFAGSVTFKVTKAEYDATENTVKMSGSGAKKTIMILRPSPSATSFKAAVWTVKGGQDDIMWVKLSKASDGTWKGTIDTEALLRNGRAAAHVYMNGSTLAGKTEFNVTAVNFPACDSEDEYIERIAAAAQRVCKKYGYLPSVLIGQSCLENGYGIPAYWDNPGVSALLRYNNMIGMKSELLNNSWYDKTVWPGKSIVKKTPEEIDGRQVIITDSFRIYDEAEQSFADFLLFLTYASNNGYGGTPKYGKAVINIKDPKTLITTVSKKGYATDSKYAEQVMKIINKHNLTKYDDLSKTKPTIY